MKVIETLKKLKEQHPEYKNEIQEAINAYDFPLYLFMQREARYRLKDQIGVPTSTENFSDMVDVLVHSFEKSDYFLDNDTIIMLANDVASEFSISIKNEDDLNVVKDNVLIDVNESDKEIIAEYLANDSIHYYKKILKYLDTIDFITLDKLKDL